MEYEDTIGVILYLKPYQPYYIQISHDSWFDYYKSCVSYEENHTPGSLKHQHNPKSVIQKKSIQNNLISLKIDLSDNPLWNLPWNNMN